MLVVGPVALRACRPIPPVGTWPVPITTNLKLGGVLPSPGPVDLPASCPLARTPMGSLVVDLLLLALKTRRF